LRIFFFHRKGVGPIAEKKRDEFEGDKTSKQIRISNV